MVETTERISQIELEQPGRTPELLRRWSFDYADPGATPRSLLSRIRLTGFSRTRDGQNLAVEAPPVSFDYTALAPRDQRIERASGLGDPPPPLGEDVTLFDYHGTGLPGILRLTREGGRFWKVWLSLVRRKKSLWTPVRMSAQIVCARWSSGFAST